MTTTVSLYSYGLASLTLCALAGCVGGQRTSTATATPPPSSKQPMPETAKPAPSGKIAALIEHEGETLAEIPLGSDDGLALGTLLRAYGPIGDQTAFKGMVQITEIIDGKRSMARSIGLTDRTTPLAIGDTVRLVDLGASYQEFKRDLAKDRKDLDAKTDREDDAFVNVRTHYQNELAAVAARYEAQRLIDNERLDRTLQGQQDQFQLERQRLHAEHQADLVTLQAALTDEAQRAVVRERDQSIQREANLRTTIAALQVNTDRLGAEIALSRQASIDIQKDYDRLVERHRQEILAELETRQILEKRLHELGDKPTSSPVAIVLTRDPKHPETVFSRLERTTNQLADADKRNQELTAQLTIQQATCSEQATTLADLRARMTLLEQSDQRAVLIADRMAELEKAQAQLKQIAAQHELGRLEAEREIYDITAQLLSATDLDTMHVLQERLRKRIADTQVIGKASP